MRIRKASEHGLGHLLNAYDPADASTDWISKLWEWIVRVEGGENPDEPEWFDLPALSRTTVSSPHVLGPFESGQAGLPYADQIKPFSFLLSGHVVPLGYPAGYDPTRFHLYAPYSTDPTAWLRLPWFDVHSRDRVRVTTGPHAPPHYARLKTYRDVAERYRTHPEPKSCGGSGAPCDRQTRGLLRPRPIRAVHRYYIGKESNRLDAVQEGRVHQRAQVFERYEDPAEWQRLRNKLKAVPARELAERTGWSVRYVKKIRNGERPTQSHIIDKMIQALRSYPVYKGSQHRTQ